MNKSEQAILVRNNIIVMENVEYIIESDINVSPRIENVFTPSELRCGREIENSFILTNSIECPSEKNVINSREIPTNLSTDIQSGIPTFEINDSDEDVIFVAEYPNVAQDDAQGDSSCGTPYSNIIDGEETSSDSSVSDVTTDNIEIREPRRNPTRNARNKKYKKKCSEYITDEDLNVLIASDDDSDNIDMNFQIDEPIYRDIRPKKVVIKKWPAEGLHERPEYNEVTGKIEKFDSTIRQIEKTTKKIQVVKPKTMKIQKKKYIQKKFSFKNGRNKIIPKKKEIIMVPYEDLKELLSETQFYLSEVFIKTINECRQKQLHICNNSLKSEESSEGISIEEGIRNHEECRLNLEELIRNQSQLYHLGSEDSDFNDTYKNLTNKVEK